MPRHLYPKEFQNYNNLIVSCDEKNSCGKYKGNNYNDNLINPVIDNPAEYFDYNIASGEIIPKNNDESSKEYIKARYTIETLNLNSYELRTARINLVNMLSDYTGENKECIQYFLDDRQNFPSLIKLFMEV